jgi:hypothetical protein
MTKRTPGSGGTAPVAGTVVSTARSRGTFFAGDFDSDDQAVQHAYDRMIADPALPRTLILDAPGRPFAFAGALDLWQSHSRVTSTGGITITPAAGYAGPLITSARRDDTERGEDGLICDVTLDHLWLNGHNQSLGIKLKHIQLSTIHDLHVRNTNGPGLWLSDYCIENLFSNLVLSDECGNVEQPALLLEPESNEYLPGTPSLGNITVNSTRFAGTMIHFPTNAALRIGLGPAQLEDTRRQRKIQFSGCFFHGHERMTGPLVTIAEAYELAFVGTQMLAWRDEGAVFQLGVPDAPLPAGNTLISHCIFASKPGSDCSGIHTANVDTASPCLAAFGNSFGSHRRPLAHAVDWGDQPGKSAAWAGNALNTTGAPHVGTLPVNADAPPFEEPAH